MIPTQKQIKDLLNLPYYESVDTAIFFREAISAKIVEIKNLASVLEVVMIELAKRDPPPLIVHAPLIVSPPISVHEDKKIT